MALRGWGEHARAMTEPRTVLLSGRQAGKGAAMLAALKAEATSRARPIVVAVPRPNGPTEFFTVDPERPRPPTARPPRPRHILAPRPLRLMRPPKPGLVLRFALPELRAIAAHVGGLPRFSGREPVGIVADRTRRPRVGSERIAKINALSSSGYGRDHVRVAVPFPMRMPAR